MSEPLLSAKRLTKRFGGLAAVNEVSVDLWLGRIHAVIGPNGAGKSTLTNLLVRRPATHHGHRHARRPGRHRLDPRKDLACRAWDAATRRRISSCLSPSGRTYGWRRSRARPHAGALAQSRRPISRRATSARAGRIELAGLQDRTQRQIAGTISHGEQRQLEIAMTLATDPKVLLLDEPLAGMGTAEAQRMVDLLLKLKAEHAMMLVEHDMDAVFALADQLTVMVNGQVIASGKPADIRADANVQSAYLGEEH